MPELRLTDRQQRALRALITSDAVPGTPLPPRHVLEHVATLIPCHSMRVIASDSGVGLLNEVEVVVTHGHPGPRQMGCRDTLVLSSRSGGDVVVQLILDRHTGGFGPRDLAMLSLLEPVLDRFFREPLAHHLPNHLTVQERRVLRHVGAGLSNAQIADRMGIAPCTVRKHLEHAFPKLGVRNRLAAALAFESRARAGSSRDGEYQRSTSVARLQGHREPGSLTPWRSP